MKSNFKLKRSSAILLAFVALAFMSIPGFGQSFYSNTSSARSTALGGVYVPSSDDVTDALSANPAGLTALSRPTLDLSMTTVFPRGSFTNAVNNDSQLSRTPGVLPYGAFGMPIGHSRFTFGVGFMPDLMTSANWRYTDAPGVAGATYGMQQQKSAILAGRAAAGLGIVVSRKLSLGFSVGADYNKNTLIAPYIFQSQPTLAGLKTLLNLHSNGYGWNGSVGALYTPTRKLQLGFAWKSSTVIVSHGNATGDAYAQFDALGLNGVPASFHYNAQVRNVLPQSALFSANWQPNHRWLLAFQSDFVNWGNAFEKLPVTLTNGTNTAINGLVGSTTLLDTMPLNWKNQYSFHVGAERSMTERTALRFGYGYGNDPIPGSTLTPMTAAIMKQQISTGFAYTRGHSRFEVAYSFDPSASEHVQQSNLLSGEYNNSTVHVGMQYMTLSYSFHF